MTLIDEINDITKAVLAEGYLSDAEDLAQHGATAIERELGRQTAHTIREWLANRKAIPAVPVRPELTDGSGEVDT